MSHALVFLSSKHLANTVTSAKTERDLVYASQIRVVFGDLASKSKDARSDVCRKMEVCPKVPAVREPATLPHPVVKQRATAHVACTSSNKCVKQLTN